MSDALSPIQIFLASAEGLDAEGVQLVGQRLLARWEEARAAWPGVELPAHDFARQLARHRAQASGALAFLDGVNAVDLYLASACALGKKGALQAFDRAVMSRVPAFVARVDASPSFADEVCQQLRTRLLVSTGGGLPRIAEYAGSGPLVGWLRVTAVRTALNLRRNRDDRPHEDLDEATVGRLEHEAEADVLRAQHQRAFQEALREAFSHLSAEDRNILRMHFAGGLSGDRIADLLQVNRSTIVRRLARIRSEMFQETRRLLSARLRLPPEELDSFIRVMRSRLNMSLTSLLKESP